jgi:hypothetical protein
MNLQLILATIFMSFGEIFSYIVDYGPVVIATKG